MSNPSEATLSNRSFEVPSHLSRLGLFNLLVGLIGLIPGIYGLGLLIPSFLTLPSNSFIFSTQTAVSSLVLVLVPIYLLVSGLFLLRSKRIGVATTQWGAVLMMHVAVLGVVTWYVSNLNGFNDTISQMLSGGFAQFTREASSAIVGLFDKSASAVDSSQAITVATIAVIHALIKILGITFLLALAIAYPLAILIVVNRSKETKLFLRHNKLLSLNRLVKKKSFVVLSSLVGLFVIYFFMLSRFELPLLFTDTIVTGGDTASWYQPLQALKEEFLPNLRLFGYSHSNFFGYLEGQHYFVLPFLLPALLGYVMPLTVALKIATFLGIFALPLTTFFAVKSMSKNHWTALAGSSLSLLFLFNESYTMFGGNLLSTFAGEFCYSWAIAFLPLFIASVWKDHHSRTWSLKSGVLLGIIGLSHIFVLMVAFFLPFFFAFRSRHFFAKEKKARLPALALLEARPQALVLQIPFTYLVGVLMMGFWIVPMVLTRKWAQSISMIWHFNSFAEAAGTMLMPVWVGASIAAIAIIFQNRRSKNALLADGSPNRFAYQGAYILYAMAACAFMFLAATVLEIPGIRFVPAALIVSIFAYMIFMESNFLAMKKFKQGVVRPLAVLVFLIIALVLIPLIGVNAPGWFRWNYTGYEDKREWNNLTAMSDAVRGNINDGRILWEKQPQADNADFGSERGFENLFHFTGRPSMEGIHYGSSFMSRQTTYLQSTYSPSPVDPEAHRLYSKVDPPTWPLRFTQANARFIIAYSDGILEHFRNHPDFQLFGAWGKFHVFEFKGFKSSYIDILPSDALSIVKDSAGGFKTDFYRFYRDYELVARPFVPESFSDDLLKQKVASNFGSYDDIHQRFFRSDEWRSYAQTHTLAQVSNESVGDHLVTFKTTQVGKPHIIKISFAPSWKSKNGEKLYPVAPGFMLIYPEQADVELVYQRSADEYIGLILTLLMIPVIIFRKRIAALEFKHFRPVFIVAVVVFVIATGTFLAMSLTGPGKMYIDIERARLLNNMPEQSSWIEAMELVKPYATKAYLEKYDNRQTYDAYRIMGDYYKKTKRPDEARKYFSVLLRRYPHSRDLGYDKDYFLSE